MVSDLIFPAREQCSDFALFFWFLKDVSHWAGGYEVPIYGFRCQVRGNRDAVPKLFIKAVMPCGQGWVFTDVLQYSL